MTLNAWKWVGILGLGALVGLGEVLSDANFPGWWDLFRHCGLGMIAPAAGLLTTLTKKNGN